MEQLDLNLNQQQQEAIEKTKEVKKPLHNNPFSNLSKEELNKLKELTSHFKNKEELETPVAVEKEEVKHEDFILKPKTKEDKKKTKALSLKLEKTIVDAADEISKKAGIDRNQYIQLCVDYCNKNVKWSS